MNIETKKSRIASELVKLLGSSVKRKSGGKGKSNKEERVNPKNSGE